VQYMAVENRIRTALSSALCDVGTGAASQRNPLKGGGKDSKFVWKMVETLDAAMSKEIDQQHEASSNVAGGEAQSDDRDQSRGEGAHGTGAVEKMLRHRDEAEVRKVAAEALLDNARLRAQLHAFRGVRGQGERSKGSRGDHELLGVFANLLGDEREGLLSAQVELCRWREAEVASKVGAGFRG
jgi:hypothetical protein